MTLQEFQERYSYDLSADKLGEGGFGSVFKAYDNHRDRWVALKISKVKPEFESTRLRKEVELVSKLPTHPNIAYYEACYTFRQMDGEYDFGILQFYEEGNLGQLLREDGRDASHCVSTEQKAGILRQILEGVDFLHAQGIIHRDLKPQNILIVRRQNGEYIPKITDFGISKQLDINKSSVFSNSLPGAGTFAYSSPEQLGGREIRKNTDLWSFGVIAFQTFTGELPFTTGEHTPTSESGRLELFRQIVSGKLPKAIDTVPEPWQALIRACIETDAAKRVKNVQEVKAILAGQGREGARKAPPEADGETRIEQTPQQSAAPPPSGRDKKGDVPAPQPLPIKKYILFAAAAAAVVLLLIFGWKGLTRNDDNNTNQTAEVVNSTVAANTSVVDTQPATDLSIAMVYVQGGTFTMGCTSEQGSDCFDDEKPAHQVTLSSFYIGKYEVTQAEWKSVMGANPSYFKGDNLPVESVSWSNVQEFIHKLNAQTGKQYRLPTEAEWEYASRGGLQSTHYKYSGSNTAGNVAWYNENSGSKTHPVGTKSPNELGIYDMSGNVWEWCSDWYGNYSASDQMNPQGPSSGSDRVFRGGSWGYGAGGVRVSNRGVSPPDGRDGILGFRLACSSN